MVALFNRHLGVAETARPGWLVMGVAFGALMSLSYLIMAALVRERKAKAVTGELHLLREYRSALAVHGYLQVLLLFVTVTLGLGIISSMLPFFLRSGLSLSGDQQTLVLGLLFGVAIVALPLWNLVSARLDKRLAFALGLATLCFSAPLLAWFSPPGQLSPWLLGMTVIAGVGTSTVLLFPWAMIPDVVEFDELKTGQRREGLFYAIFTFGQKTAFAVGAFLNAQMLSLMGYEREAVQQSGEAVLGIRFMVGPLAALIFALALVLVLRFPISKASHDEARARLKDHNHNAQP